MTNSRGDVEYLYRGDGTVKAHYTYDAWGNVLSVTDENGIEITDANNIGLLNPIRYRGYYYDSETGYYYLQSRYYDPEMGRFINGDGYADTGMGLTSTNMFSYCGNNPIVRADPTGEFWGIVALVATAIVATVAVVTAVCTGNAGSEARIVDKRRVNRPIVPRPSPITIDGGVEKSEKTYSNGDSSKLLSAYAEGRSDNWLLSSAGVALNIAKFSVNISLGLDDIGISFSYGDNESSNSFGLTANISQLKVGFEGAHSSVSKWDSNITESAYTNASIDGMFLIMALSYFCYGQPIPNNQLQPA